MSRPSEASRDARLDNIKGILIYLVVIGHSLQFISYNNLDFWDDPVFKLIYIFHMPLFMSVSGYIAGVQRKGSPLVALLAKRSAQLLIPMLFWSTALTMLGLLHRGGDGWAAVPKELLGFLLNAYWFIWAILIAFTFTETLLRCFHRPLVLVISTNVVCLLPVEGLNLELVRYTLPFFVLGYLVRRYNKKANLSATTALAAAAVSIFVFMVWTKDTYIYNNRGVFNSPSGAMELILMYTGAISFQYLFILSHRYFYQCGNTWFVSKYLSETVGTRTLQIYLLQGVIGMFAANRVPILAIPFWERDILAVIFAICLTTVLAQLVRFSERWDLFNAIAWGKNSVTWDYQFNRSINFGFSSKAKRQNHENN